MHELTRSLRLYLAATLLLVGCSSSGGSSPTATAGAGAATKPPAVASPSAAASPSAVASPSASAVAQGQTVNMTDTYQFQPATLTVPRGTTVTWMNTGQQQHTVTDDPAKAANRADAQLPNGAQPWDSGLIDAGKTFTHTFDTPGDYTYFCMPHEALGMVARITVSG